MKNSNISQEILDEIKDMAPTLATLKKSNPYRLPSQYFDHLNNQITTQLTSDPYKVSDRYFENLADNIQESIAHQKIDSKPKPRIVRMISGIAASILLVGAIYYLIPNGVEEINDGLAVAESELYLEENIDDLELEELMELDITSEEDLFESESLSKEVLELYLEENIDDFNIEELTELL